MPAPPQYKKGFKVKKGMVISGYKLKDVTVKHVRVKIFRHYKYPTKMVFTPINKNVSLFIFKSKLKKFLQSKRIIYSYHHNPYRCSFYGSKQLRYLKRSNGDVVVSCEGECFRVL